MELMRRLLTLICVLVAVWTAVVTAPGVYQVKLVDFSREQQSTLAREAEGRRKMGKLVGEDMTRDLVLSPSARGSVGEFARSETRGKTHRSRGPGWSDLVAQVAALTDGTAEPAVRAVHASRNGLAEYTYYALDGGALQELRGVIGPRKQFTYVEVGTPRGPQYLAVTYLTPVDALRSAAPALTSPYRHQSPWWLLAGLLLYAFLPWPVRSDDILRYNLARSVVVPDILGFALAGGFYALALLAVSRDSNMYALLEASSWVAVSLWSLLFTLFGLAVLTASLWYAGFSMRLLPDGIRLTTWGYRVRQVFFSDLAEVREYTARAPRWLVVVAGLAFLSRPVQGGGSLALLLQGHPGVELVRKDGGVMRFVTEYLPGWTRLLDSLLASGVPLSPALTQAQARERNVVVPTRASLPWTKALLVGLLAVCIGLGGRAWLTHQDAAPPVPERTLTDVELVAEQKVLAEMQQVPAQLQAAFDRWEKAPAAQKDAAYAEYQAWLDRSQTLSDRFDLIHSGHSELAPLK